jgi:S1-C subfamily serine protease
MSRRTPPVLSAAVVLGGCGGAAPAVTHPPPAPLRVTVAGAGLVPEQATGFVVGPARVVTVAHVLDGGAAVRVAGRPARVVRVDRRLDLAVLAVSGLRARAARPAAAGGVEVLRGGRPHALRARVRRSVTATVKGPGGAVVRPALELAAAVQPGDSGAPVTDGSGRVIGVVFARSDAGRPTAWAVDARAVRSFVSASSASRRRPGS